MSSVHEEYPGYDEYFDYLEHEYEMEDEEPMRATPTDTENVGMLERQQEYLRDKRDIELMGDEIEKKAREIYPKEKEYHSVILKYFTPDTCIRLEKIRRTFSVSPEQKEIEIKRVLTEFGIPFRPLGIGTNRLGVLIDGYVIKIACDIDGMIDNKREFLYSLALQPYVVKTYECNPTGLLSVCEYVDSLQKASFDEGEVKSKMREVLKDISAQFFIGDVGITSANYGNWGFRIETKELVILDYAYIYSVAFNLFQCTCRDKGTLYYDRDFVKLICPVCGKKFTFGEIRKRISRKDQDKEIGDIKKRGYILTSLVEKKPFNHQFVLDATETIVDEIEKDIKRKRREEEEEIVIDSQSYEDEETKGSIQDVLKKYAE